MDNDLPRGQRADQVLTSQLFGLTATTSDNFVQEIEEYTRLKSLSNDNNLEQAKIKCLEQELSEAFGSPETELQRFVETAVSKTLDTMAAQVQFDPQALSFETRRQLRNLFNNEGM